MKFEVLDLVDVTIDWECPHCGAKGWRWFGRTNQQSAHHDIAADHHAQSSSCVGFLTCETRRHDHAALPVLDAQEPDQ